MNRRLFSILGLIILSILLFGAGIWVGQTRAFNTNWQPGWMMGNTNNVVQPGYNNMMGNAGMMGMMMNNGMMDYNNGQYMPGMMNGQAGNMMGGTGMMGMMTGFSGLSGVEPLTIDEAETAVTGYLASLNNDDLRLGEIMIFDNHAYAQIMDESTESGAFEVLVDPVTGNVFPEPGPNMMWNTEYGMMSGFGSGMMGMMGDSNMMGSFGYAPDAEINITADEAADMAQEYLDAYLSGKTADEHVDAFPGYYTLHVLEDGETVGMLSVNAYTGQVFLHHWHGDFIEMTAGEHE